MDAVGIYLDLDRGYPLWDLDLGWDVGRSGILSHQECHFQKPLENEGVIGILERGLLIPIRIAGRGIVREKNYAGASGGDGIVHWSLKKRHANRGGELQTKQQSSNVDWSGLAGPQGDSETSQ